MSVRARRAAKYWGRGGGWAGGASRGGLVADAAGRAALVASGFGPTVFTLFPFLQLYSAAFFVVPAARWLLARRANEGIAARNDARLRAAAALAAPGRALAAKLASARRFAARSPALAASTRPK
jgi:hypothetical protein